VPRSIPTALGMGVILRILGVRGVVSLASGLAGNLESTASNF
jgi:hypothetical protein